MAFAFVHVRGGGFLGSAWHAAGRAGLKVNSGRDLVDAARYLGRRGYAQPQSIALQARSAGTVPAAAALNEDPQLFAAAALDAPFLDIIGTMQNASSSLALRELGEWGDPDRSSTRSAMDRYSPLQNLRAQSYPALMLRASIDDPLVSYGDAVRYSARLQELKQDGHELLMRIYGSGGHNLAADQNEQAEKTAEQMAWLIDKLTPED
jgi:oligopeptidase B